MENPEKLATLGKQDTGRIDYFINMFSLHVFGEYH
jgi:hypothetical protein